MVATIIRTAEETSMSHLDKAHRRSSYIVASIVVFLLTFIAGPGRVWGGEHRYHDEVQLSYSLSANRHTPDWYQHHPDNYHPIGCGPVAWATVYAYWSQFKGKTQLFSAPSITSYSTGDPEVTRPTEELFHHTETHYGQFNEAQYGRTWPSNFCEGIDYAKERGYRHSRCLRVRGTEFNKFEHVKRHLQADKPVVLLIKHDGRGMILDHYVVVERARIVQEKMNGKWRDRDVEYFVNYGSGAPDSKWISVRQRGANVGEIYSSGSVFLIDVSGTPLPEAADANEAACKDWCRTGDGQQQGCRMCSHSAGCGPGYKSVKSWKEAGKNWYACAQRNTRRSNASEANRSSCEQWCRDHRTDQGCVKCDTRVDCGIGYRSLKTWRGYGNNWHACRVKGDTKRERASAAHHQSCQQWCDANRPDCTHCSKRSGCGVGFKSLKSWKDYGTNWYACGKSSYGQSSEKNQNDCNVWCSANDPPCEMCSTNKGCGRGYTSMRSWTGGGKNWHACRVASAQSNRQACEIWCNQHKPRCAKCSSKSGCGRGYDRIERFRGRGENWYACEVR
jgi:hypothetical protein